MSYSYQKQIERLLDFVQKVSSNTSCFVDTLNGEDFCAHCEAKQLLNDEPVNYTYGKSSKPYTIYGLLENPERKAPERKYNYPRYF
jgi:hypothetical protein